MGNIPICPAEIGEGMQVVSRLSQVQTVTIILQVLPESCDKWTVSISLLYNVLLAVNSIDSLQHNLCKASCSSSLDPNLVDLHGPPCTLEPCTGVERLLILFGFKV